MLSPSMWIVAGPTPEGVTTRVLRIRMRDILGVRRRSRRFSERRLRRRTPRMTFFESFNELTESGAPFVSVTVVDTLGSTPQDRGAKMLVTREGRYFGTVGGGKIEARAIEEA